MIRQFIEKNEKIPTSVHDVVGTHILIYSDKQVIPLSHKLREIEDNLYSSFEEQSKDVQITDLFICMQAISKLHINIVRRISLFLYDNKDIFDAATPEGISGQEYHQFLEDYFLDHYEAFYRKDEDREHITAILRRFRYKTKLYELIKQLVPQVELEAIENDYLFNFNKYANDFYKYYHEFYIRSDKAKPDMASTLLDLAKDNDPDYEGYEPYTLQFDIDLYKPIEHVMEELDDFRNAAYMMLVENFGSEEFRSDSVKRLGYHSLKDYLRDNSGKLEEKNNMSAIFNKWERYLQIYDMVKIKGYTLSQTKNIINKKLSCTMTDKVESTINNECAEAARLIESAVQGTFPYYK